MTKDIQTAICTDLILDGKTTVCENFDYVWEMDVAYISKTGFITEYEVKISRSDFKADSKKVAKFRYINERNKWYIPNYFNYVCPMDMISVTEIPDWAGLLYYDEGKIILIKKAKRLHGDVVHELEKMLRKMVRLHIERKYLGCAYMTYRDRMNKIKRSNERVKNEIENL